MLRVATLFSGSSGNCTLLRTDNTAILVDCGKNCKAVCEALKIEGMDIADIDAIFVTHEHRDHISALDVLMRKRAIPIHVTSPSAPEVCKGRSAAENVEVHSGLIFEQRVGDITVSSFPLPHDSAAHVGYTVMSDDGDRAGVATDMGYATMEAFNRLSGCRQIVLEANHDIPMLKGGPYPYYLKQRILSRRGHLSNEECASLCRGLAEKGCEAFILSHLSAENNTPDLALSAVQECLYAGGLSPAVTVAKRSEVTDI